MSHILTLLCISLFVPLMAFSQEWIVTAKSGEDAKVTLSDKTEAKIKIGQKLKLGEDVATGADTKLKLTSKESVLVVAEKTNLTLGTLYEKERVLDLKSGKIRIQVDHELAKIMKFKTPSSVSGVRGTEIFMNVGTDKEAICVLEGLVETKDLTTQKSVQLKQNQGWFKEAGKETKVQETSPEQRKKWLEATTF